ncbi:MULTISPECIES: PH domain-containing protein [unclassified Staphylococcus]|uniref:PH domain-containing protein n=1 Tax=unclassified Staphylococcus TaxID=91994 RepID=UPI0021D356D2|nr:MULTISPECIES: PH domain-containing protein [unclassified Staphylococcus]UXR69114.1 PH domain-containing protein [Staphylococcus sp. IVB6246]UXR73441.1 PH domain-containing protein [Staphylococcus sp. IVB6238]UXR75758.1 PH domain-containing protein [Staphylococcus sp. IVB6233]UXR79956.1 PH domain-containing protein [Staphylococcus sp. IVB6218]
MASSFHKSPEVAKKYFRQFYFLTAIVGALPLIIGLFLVYHFEAWQPLLYLIGGVLALFILYCTLKPYFQYHYTTYRIHENIIEVKRHFWFRNHQILKVERLQYIHWKNGPLLRRHQLRHLILTTAGHTMHLPLLYGEDVELIEQHCLELLEEGDSDV